MSTMATVRQNLDTFLELYKKTKAPEVRDFLMQVNSSLPQLFGAGGNAAMIIPSNVIDEIKAATPVTAPRGPRGQRYQRREKRPRQTFQLGKHTPAA